MKIRLEHDVYVKFKYPDFSFDEYPPIFLKKDTELDVVKVFENGNYLLSDYSVVKLC